MAFNGLTDAQAERLDYLQEELAEVIVAIGKIKRHGYESRNPDVLEHLGNRRDLEIELGQVIAAVRLLVNAEDLDNDVIESAMQVKLIQHRHGQAYMHHQDE